MNIWQIIGIILAIVVVFGIVITYILKRNMFNVWNWLPSKKHQQQNSLQIYRQVMSIFKSTNIEDVKVNNSELIIKVKKSVNYGEIKEFKITQIDKLTYQLVFENNSYAESVYKQVKFTVR